MMSEVPQSILTIYGPFVVLFLLLLEGSFSLLRGDKVYALKDTLSNMSITFVGNILSRVLWAVLAFKAYDWAYRHAFFQIDMNTWWSWVLLMVLADFAWYWEHRAGHEWRLFWGVHSIHHSSEKFNYSTSLRLPWLGPVTRIPFLMPLALLGFSPVAVLTSFSIVFLYQIFPHTTYVKNLGFLEGILNTPSHHRVHHASNLLYLDKNYGGILIFWDRLFGTFQPETEPPVYGILHPIDSHNPVVINSRDLLQTFRDASGLRSPLERLKFLFGRPV